MAMQGTLVRCPKCIAPISGGVSLDGVINLDPERNVCPKCLHVFRADQALIEEYTGHGGYGSSRAHHPERKSRDGKNRSTSKAQRAPAPAPAPISKDKAPAAAGTGDLFP